MDDHSEALRWFTHARFGMFIHWALYAMLGRGEWARYNESIPPDEYHALAQSFQPRSLDAAAWARQAKAAGMKYMVLPANPPARPFNVVKLELDGPAQPHYFY